MKKVNMSLSERENPKKVTSDDDKENSKMHVHFFRTTMKSSIENLVGD